jgi:hypothetical protein
MAVKKTREDWLKTLETKGEKINAIPGEFQNDAFYLAAVERNMEGVIRHIPAERLTPKFCLAAVRQDGRVFSCLPDKVKSAELCKAAINAAPAGDASVSPLADVPESRRTAGLCLAAVRKAGGALEYVPEKLRTAAICLAAVEQNGWALEYVPEALKADIEAKFRKEAAKKRGLKTEADVLALSAKKVKDNEESFIDVFYLLPEELKTEKVCRAAIEINGAALSRTPQKLRNAEICLAAVRQTGFALEYVPEKLMTFEICLAAVQRTGAALQYAPDNLKTPELCVCAVKKDGRALGYVPAALQALVRKAALMKGPHLKRFLAGQKEAAGKAGTGRASKQKKTPAPEELPAEDETRVEDMFDAFYSGIPSAFKVLPPKYKTREISLIAASAYDGQFKYVPDEFLTAEFVLAAIKLSKGAAIQSAPDKFLTPEICLAAVTERYGNLKYLGRKRCTEKLCRAAVDRDAFALKYVPGRLKTFEICLAAVERCGLMLEYVPDRLKTGNAKAPGLCLAAVRQNGRALEYVPKEARTEELCFTAVKQDGLMLRYTPENIRAKGPRALELCEEALKKNGVLADVPEKFHTPALYMTAVKSYGFNLRFVPEDFMTEKLCRAAVKNFGGALEYVPDDLKTEEICFAALWQDELAFDYIPPRIKTGEFYIAALGKNAGFFRDIPKTALTAEMCAIAVRSDGNNFRHVPDKFKTVELFRRALGSMKTYDELSGDTPFEYMPEKLKKEWQKSPDLCHLAAAKFYGNLRYTPDKFKTAGFCRGVVQKNGRALEFVPEKLRTEELCLLALKQTGFALEFVPDKFKTAEICLEAARAMLRETQSPGHPDPAEWYDAIANPPLRNVPKKMRCDIRLALLNEALGNPAAEEK